MASSWPSIVALLTFMLGMAVSIAVLVVGISPRHGIGGEHEQIPRGSAGRQILIALAAGAVSVVSLGVLLYDQRHKPVADTTIYGIQIDHDVGVVIRMLERDSPKDDSSFVVVVQAQVPLKRKPRRCMYDSTSFTPELQSPSFVMSQPVLSREPLPAGRGNVVCAFTWNWVVEPLHSGSLALEAGMRLTYGNRRWQAVQHQLVVDVGRTYGPDVWLTFGGGLLAALIASATAVGTSMLAAKRDVSSSVGVTGAAQL